MRGVFVSLFLVVTVISNTRSASGFTSISTLTSQRSDRHASTSSSSLFLSSSSSFDDDIDFMASLKSRMAQVNDSETKLPLVVLDCMLPRQVLKINVNNPVFMELVRSRLEAETPFFGMLGLARLATGEQVHLRSGVQVDIVGKPAVDDNGVKVELRAGRRFRIDGEVNNAPQGWTQARIQFLESAMEQDETNPLDRRSFERATLKAKQFTELVDKWIALARTKERQASQIDRLLVDLGNMPAPEEPSELAFWVGALINPIPAMGVALEIRPSLLTAKTAEDRVDVALKGIQRSIKHMTGDEPLV